MRACSVVEQATAWECQKHDLREQLGTLDMESAEREFYPSLEILRGLCATQVFLWHVFAHISPRFFSGPMELPYHLMWRLSETAVLSFMVISGFVVTNSFFHYRRTSGSDFKAVRVFLSARAIRIWSLSIPVALVSFLLTQVYRNWADDWRVWRRFDDPDLLLLSIFGFHKEWIGPGWTLLYELFAYSLLPFVMLLVFAASWKTKAISIAMLGLVWSFYVGWLNIDTVTAVPMLSCFLIGVLAYFGRHKLQAGGIGGFILLASGLGGLVAIALVQEVAFDNMGLKFAACAALFVGTLSLSPGDSRISEWLQLLGASSYSLYLWHWPVLYFGNFYTGYLLYGEGSASAWTPTLVMINLGVWVPMVFLVTWLSYTCVERHARMSVVMTFARRRKAKPAE